MLLRIFRDIILFVLIFSFINDNAMVDVLGEYSLKVIFILFLVVNIPNIINSTTKNSSSLVMKSFNYFMIIVTIVTLISVIFLNQIELMDGLMVLISIYVVFIYFSNYLEFDKLLYIIWANVFISAVISLFNDPIAEFTFRTSGGTVDPVEFSGHLFMGIFLTIYLFNKNRNYIFLIVPNLLFLYAMLYAGSKTAILTLSILFLYTLVARFGFIFRYIFSLKGFVSMVIVLAVIFQSNVFNKLDAFQGLQERAKTQGTADQRFISWEAGFGMIADHPFTGVGLNQYAHQTEKYLKNYLAIDGYDPHNIFVKIFAETGIFSFLSFLVFLFFILKTKYFEILRSDYFWISLVPLSAVLMGLSIGITYEKHFWLSFALLSNIILLHGKYEKEKAL